MSSQEQKVTEMFNDISKTYDKVNSILSFGIDRLWRKKLLKALPRNQSQSLLDIATGTGEVLLHAIEAKVVEKGVGIDLAEKMLIIGQAKAQEQKLTEKALFKVGNALELPFEDNSFECASCSFGIRNVQDVPKALQEAYRVLKPKGRLLILEFSLPKNRLLKAMHLLYLRHLLPKIGGFFSKSLPSYQYLNKTIESFPYGAHFLNLMSQAGFKKLKAHPLLGGIATLYVGDKC